MSVKKHTTEEETLPIDYPMVAKPHRGIYLMHQYRARKPENVVAKYIEHYTEKGDIILDPFVGSGVTSVEAARLGRKAIAIDLDPMGTFITRMTMKPIDLKKLQEAFKFVEKGVKERILKLYETRCPVCRRLANISHVVWRRENEEDKPIEIWYDCICSKERRRKELDEDDYKKLEEINSTQISYWFPKTKLYYEDSTSFLKKERVNYVYELFTKRNLLAFSMLYHAIEGVDNEDARNILKLNFTAILALSSKLNRVNVGGYKSKGRGWTVHSYWIPSEHLEQNVWDDFERHFRRFSFKYKQKDNNLIRYYNEAASFEDLLNEANVLISTQSALNLSNIPDNSIDYVFTDPPYGGSIQYLELSTMWASWLGFKMNYEEEVTINPHQRKSLNYYHMMLCKAFREVYRVLKLGHWLTVTFHSTNVDVYNSIIRAVTSAGFELKKIVYQPPSTKKTFNRTLNPHGTATGDYYLQFKKPQIPEKVVKEEIDKERYRKAVIREVVKILCERGEPTPYQYILNGIYPGLDKEGYLLMTNPVDIKKIIEEYGEFIYRDGEGWWFQDPSKYKINTVPLHGRIETAILQVLRREFEVSFDDILQEIFLQFRNALTPNPPSIKAMVEEYAMKTKKKWRLKPIVSVREGEHSKMIGYLAEIGKKMGFEIWVGLNEQGKIYKEKPLSRLSEDELTISIMENETLNAIKMIDVLWIRDNDIAYEFEVEYTTNITDTIIRGSYIPRAKRFMVIPEEREKLLFKKISAPYHKNRIEKYGWKFIFFKDIEKFYEAVKRKRKLSEKEFEKIGRMLKPKVIAQKSLKKYLQ